MSAGLRSMTGFGTATAESPRYRVTVDARSVNHRSLDMVVRTREPYRSAEKGLRDLVGSRVARGRVELYIEAVFVGSEAAEVRVDHGAARSVLAALEELAEESRLTAPSAGDLLRVPGVVQVSAGERDWTAEDEELLLATARQALDGLVVSRAEEGRKLAIDLEQGVERLAESREELAGRREVVVDRTQESLRERLDALLKGAAIDEGRLEQEVALLVEKADVAEEIDRLAAHVGQLGDALASTEPAGKRIDFLLQEVLRELNTIGAKCRDLDMSRTVLEARLTAEQMREQVQNVE